MGVGEGPVGVVDHGAVRALAEARMLATVSVLSTSLSLARTLTVFTEPPSLTVAESAPATGASFTALTVMFTVAVAVRPAVVDRVGEAVVPLARPFWV